MIVTVIGLGTFGGKTASRLFEKGAEVVAIDNNPELVDKIKDLGNKLTIHDKLKTPVGEVGSFSE